MSDPTLPDPTLADPTLPDPPMADPERLPETRSTAPRRLTSAVLTGGVLVAAICFAIAIVAEMAGVEAGAGDMTDVDAVFSGLAVFTPWAWATLGSYAVVLTPALGLIATAWEYATIRDRRTVLLAAAVLAVLTASAIIAILR